MIGIWKLGPQSEVKRFTLSRLCKNMIYAERYSSSGCLKCSYMLGRGCLGDHPPARSLVGFYELLRAETSHGVAVLCYRMKRILCMATQGIEGHKKATAGFPQTLCIFPVWSSRAVLTPVLYQMFVVSTPICWLLLSLSSQSLMVGVGLEIPNTPLSWIISSLSQI